MVNPGVLPLSIIRGIEFPGLVLQCKDDSVSVSIDSGPELIYLPSGNYGGYPLFIQAGTPAAFLYYNPTALTYIIADTLTNGGLTDYFILPDATEPTGTYTGVGSFGGSSAVATDHPVDLTGLTAEAVVRRNSNADVALNLNPSITDPTAGEITIPPISSDDTLDFDFVGTFRWDLVLISGGGSRFGPYLKGPFTVSDNITQPTPVNA